VGSNEVSSEKKGRFGEALGFLLMNAGTLVRSFIMK